MAVLTIFMFESQLIQMPGPRDIVIYRPTPGHFLLCKRPGAGHTFRCKSPRVPGGMVTGQIDTCITCENCVDQPNEDLQTKCIDFNVLEIMKSKEIMKISWFR